MKVLRDDGKKVESLHFDNLMKYKRYILFLEELYTNKGTLLYCKESLLRTEIGTTEGVTVYEIVEVGEPR